MAGREVVRLPLATLLDDPSNPRVHFHDETQAGLTRSLATRGQLVPILVREEGGKRFIVEGHRRVRSARALGWAEVDGILLTGPLTPLDVLLHQLALGIHHDNLGPISLARGFERALKEGKSRAEIVKETATSEPTLCRKLKLLALSLPLQDRVERGELSERDARRIVDTTKDHARQEELASRLLKAKSGPPGEAPDAEGDRDEGEPRSRKMPRLALCLGRGRTVSLAGPGLESLDAAVEWMEELLAHAKKARAQRLALDTFARLLRDQTEPRAGKASKEAS